MVPIQTFDLPSVKAFAQEFETIFYNGDAAGMTAYYTADAKLIAEGIKPSAGLSYAYCTLLLHFQLPDGLGLIEVDISSPVGLVTFQST